MITHTATFAAELTAVQMKCADQIISVFENESLKIKYDYIEHLEPDDGRGYTAGRSGFVTKEADL